jgi:hypothetical protein
MKKYRVAFGWTGKWELIEKEAQAPCLAEAFFDTPEEALLYYLKETEEMIELCRERMTDLYKRKSWAQTKLATRKTVARED